MPIGFSAKERPTTSSCGFIFLPASLTPKLLEGQDSFSPQHLEDLAQCLTLRESVNGWIIYLDVQKLSWNFLGVSYFKLQILL